MKINSLFVSESQAWWLGGGGAHWCNRHAAMQRQRGLSGSPGDPGVERGPSAWTTTALWVKWPLFYNSRVWGAGELSKIKHLRLVSGVTFLMRWRRACGAAWAAWAGLGSVASRPPAQSTSAGWPQMGPASPARSALCTDISTDDMERGMSRMWLAAAWTSPEFPPPATSSVLSMDLLPPCLQKEALLMAVCHMQLPCS